MDLSGRCFRLGDRYLLEVPNTSSEFIVTDSSGDVESRFNRDS